MAQDRHDRRRRNAAVLAGSEARTHRVLVLLTAIIPAAAILTVCATLLAAAS